MDLVAFQITSLTIVYSTVYSDADQRKHQSSASLAFVWGIHRGPVNSPHKWPATRNMFPFDVVIMYEVWVTAYDVGTHSFLIFNISVACKDIMHTDNKITLSVSVNDKTRLYVVSQWGKTGHMLVQSREYRHVDTWLKTGTLLPHYACKIYYCQVSNIRRTKSLNLNVSCLVLQLSLHNLLKSGVKSRMKMLKQLGHAMLQLHLSEKHFITY